MMRSMTGYGRHEQLINGRQILTEIKSVNHKYLETSTRVSKGYGFIENKTRNFIKEKVSRGKIDVFISVEDVNCEDVHVCVNHPLALEYFNALDEISKKCGVVNNISSVDIASYPDVLTVCRNTLDENEIWNDVEIVLNQALTKFIQMRELEGKQISLDINSKLIKIHNMIDNIENNSIKIVADYKDKLKTRIKELVGDTEIDEQRLITEAAIFADRIAIDEEIVRLRSHIEQLNLMTEHNEPVGRKIDFMIQEMNREINTIGSKISDADISYTVVCIKSEIEKIREQIQNIE